MTVDALNGINNISYQTKPVQDSAPQVLGAEQINNIAVGMASGVREKQLQSKAIQQPSEDEIQKAIHQANRRAQFGHTSAQFSYHEESHSIAVKIIDSETNEVIREIPSEETLEMISRMWDLAGIMIDEKR